MDRQGTIAALCRLIRQHLGAKRDRLFDRIDYHRWDAQQSRDLEAVDEALTLLGHFDKSGPRPPP